MRIKHLHIENFRGVSTLDIGCSEHMNVFIGINGAGKSTSLTAIQYLLSWLVARVKNPKGRGLVLTDTDITRKEKHCKVALLTDEDAWWQILKYKPNFRAEREKSDMSDTLAVANRWVEQASSDQLFGENGIPVIVGYGVNRAVTEVPQRLHKKTPKEPLEVFQDAFQTSVRFRTFFEWYRNKEDDDNYYFRSKGKKYQTDNQLKAVQSAFERAMTGYSHLHTKRNPITLVMEKDGEEFRFQDLSDGEKCYFSLIADIARRLAIANPHADNPLDGEGIVLVDEIDLHLHPQWQAEVLAKLSEVFPNCQFFVTTHSPFVVSSISNNDKLFFLQNGKATEVTDKVYGQKIDHLLLEYFAMPGLRNAEVQRRMDKVWNLLSLNQFDTTEFNDNIRWLHEHVSPTDLEFARIEMEIKKRERQHAKD